MTCALDDAELAARQARLADEAFVLHLRVCERCQLANRLRIGNLACPRAPALVRRWLRSTAVALYYARTKP